MSLKVKPYFEDMICAQASPSGVGAISLIRLSGKGSSILASKLLSLKEEELVSHKAYFKKIKFEDRFVDEVLLTFFEDQKSFTGEESFEVTCHGSPLIVEDLVNLFIKEGARLAEPGEFTYRAYLNGKIDLTKAEGIHHSIHAKTDLAKDLSLNLLEGGFKNSLKEIKDLVVWAASRVEASIDFSDQDIDLDHDAEVFAKVTKAKNILSSLVDTYSVGAVQAKGITVVLCGPPNAGKSTLFNALLGDDRSIVSSEKGTTRDYITETVFLKTHPVQILDTAGLRETESQIESEGIKRSVDLALKSQLILYLVSEDTHDTRDGYLEELQATGVPILIVETKQDLGEWSLANNSFQSTPFSVNKSEYLDSLQSKMYESLSKYFQVNKNLFIQRHKVLIQEACDRLHQIADFSEISGAEDVISSLLYSSIDSLDEILYIDDPEAVRDQIFKDFCLGK